MNKVLTLIIPLLVIMSSIIYFYYVTQPTQKTFSKQTIIVITAIIMSVSLSIAAKNSLTIYFSYEISIIGTFLFWITPLASLIKTEIMQFFGEYEKIISRTILVFTAILFGLLSFAMYIELSK